MQDQDLPKAKPVDQLKEREQALFKLRFACDLALTLKAAVPQFIDDALFARVEGLVEKYDLSDELNRMLGYTRQRKEVRS